MARPFTTKESHQLAKEYEAIVRGLEEVFALEQKYRAGIPDAAEQYLIRDIETILQNIPVEELNRDKRGIRTKLLKDAGFESIGDLMGVCAEHQLCDGSPCERNTTKHKNQAEL